MNFELPVETYISLYGVPKHIREDITDEEAQQLRCIRLEYKEGHYYALASNRRIAAIYYLGKTDQPDGAVHLKLDDALLNVCEKEKAFNSKLIITAMPELQIVSIKSLFGYSYSGNAGFFSITTPLMDWRKWADTGEPPKASKGAMAWTTWDMEALNDASPSGRIVFPEFIDAMKPVILRDGKFENWLGLFMANLHTDKGVAYTVEPATLPGWFK